MFVSCFYSLLSSKDLFRQYDLSHAICCLKKRQLITASSAHVREVLGPGEPFRVLLPLLLNRPTLLSLIKSLK